MPLDPPQLGLAKLASVPSTQSCHNALKHHCRLYHCQTYPAQGAAGHSERDHGPGKPSRCGVSYNRRVVIGSVDLCKATVGLLMEPPTPSIVSEVLRLFTPSGFPSKSGGICLQAQ